MRTYKITLTDLTDLVFSVYVDAFSADSACAMVATADLYIVSVEC
jgi:hypothetical protein